MRLGVVGAFQHKTSYEAESSNLRKTVIRRTSAPLRQTAVSSWRSVHRLSKPLSVCRPSVGLCVRVFFLFQKGRKFFLFNFFRETSTLFLQLWFACRLVAAAKCVCLCALAFYFANCNILYAPLATIIKTIAPIIKSG